MKTTFLLLVISMLVLTSSSVYAGVVVEDEYTVHCKEGDFSKIQYAVNGAPAWATIHVCPGDYDEDVLIQKNGQQILSKEIGSRGANTHVRAFTIGFPSNGGPYGVIIKGFSIGGDTFPNCANDNHVGIESAGNLNEISFNHVSNCQYGIRVDKGNYANTVVQNHVFDSGTGIELEGKDDDQGGRYHVAYQNLVMGKWATNPNFGEGCIYVWASHSDVYNNNLGPECRKGYGIQVSGWRNDVHTNGLCDSDIDLSNANRANVWANTFYEGGDVLNEDNDDDVHNNKDSNKSCPWDGS